MVVLQFPEVRIRSGVRIEAAKAPVPAASIFNFADDGRLTGEFELY
jgi:hypothetical protein